MLHVKTNNGSIKINVIKNDWFNLVKKEIAKGSPLTHQDRVTGFEDNLDLVLKEIEETCEWLGIKTPAVLTQHALNELHHKYENARLFHWSEIHWSLRAVWRRLNVLIHKVENFNQKRVVVTFDMKEKVKLTQQQLDSFTLSYKSGDVLLMYPQTGKTILDVYKDGDDICSEENVYPQEYISADFVVVFDDIDYGTPEFYAWCKENGVDVEDKSNALGFYKVGEVIECEDLTGATEIVECSLL